MATVMCRAALHWRPACGCGSAARGRIEARVCDAMPTERSEGVGRLDVGEEKDEGAALLLVPLVAVPGPRAGFWLIYDCDSFVRLAILVINDASSAIYVCYATSRVSCQSHSEVCLSLPPSAFVALAFCLLVLCCVTLRALLFCAARRGAQARGRQIDSLLRRYDGRFHRD